MQLITANIMQWHGDCYLFHIHCVTVGVPDVGTAE